jgi:hypothetical protein
MENSHFTKDISVSGSICVVVYFRRNLATLFLTINVLLILTVRVVFFYARKTHNPRFLEVFRGAKTFLTPNGLLFSQGEHGFSEISPPAVNVVIFYYCILNRYEAWGK